MANQSTMAKISAGVAITEDEAAELDHDAAMHAPGWEPGDRVEGGETAADYDTGRVIEVDGNRVHVAWDSEVRTWTGAETLRAEGSRPAVAR